MNPSIRLACVFLLTAVPSIWADDLPPAEELLKLDGAALAKATAEVSFYGEEHPYTVDQLIAIAGKLAGDVKSFSDKPSGYISPFGNFFDEACGRADGQQLDQLIEIYSQLDPASFEKIYQLPPLTAAWIHRETGALSAKHPHAKLLKYEGSLPDEIVDAPKELIDAWRLYKGAMQTSEKVFKKAPPKEQVSYGLNVRSFYKLIDAVLRGEGNDLKETLLRFEETGPNCMGLHDFGDAQSVAILMILLRERRFDEAVGMALRASNSDRPLVTGPQKIDVVVELFQLIGIDWESLVSGALVDRETREWGPDRKTFLRMLAGYGSDRGASFLYQMARWVKPDDRLEYFGALPTFIDSNPTARKCGDDLDDMLVYSFDDLDRISKVSVAKSLQARLLSLLEDSSSASSPENFTSVVVSTFARTQSESSVPSLRRLTQHPSSDVAERAAKVLCAMGEKIETIVNPAPVRFQVVVNGKPLLKDVGMAWEVLLRSGRVSSVTSVKDHGIVELDRKLFSNPAKPATDVVLSSRYEKAGDAKFEVKVPVPSKLDGTTQVNISASRMELVLRNTEHLNAPFSQTCTMAMQERKPGEYDVFPRDTDWFEAPVETTIGLPEVQNGVYDVFVRLAGAETWRGSVTVGPDVQPTEVRLNPGSDLRYKILTPVGDSWNSGTLFKDGKEFAPSFDDEARVYRGLPCGNYLLHVPGSEEAGRGEGLEDRKRGPDEIPYAGRDVSFTISKGSPPLIDLGEIHLEPVSK